MVSIYGKEAKEHTRIVQKSTDKLIQSLFDKGIPNIGWAELQQEMFLNWLACHDTNNSLDVQNIGAGEREGRVVCPLVRRLNYNMSHGIGRSGNLTEVQPKALGSSWLARLSNQFAQQALKIVGITCCKAALVVPLCTGMSLSLCMTSFRRQRPSARFVVWFRVDQKSCLKAIMHAGFEPIVINPERQGDALVTNSEHLNTVLEKGADQILCVLSTTSCFAPRAPDSLEEIAAICQHYNVPHLVNNAYGLQSDECVRRLNAGYSAGRIDAFVQSLDKNFQVPVGGAIIAVCKKSLVTVIADSYPGRASSVPCRDFVLTMLHMGIDGLIKTYDAQKRVVTSTTEIKRINGCDFDFKNFGSHTHEQHGGYLNIACGVGMSDEEIDELFSRLSLAYTRFTRQIGKKNGFFRPGRNEGEDSEDDD